MRTREGKVKTLCFLGWVCPKMGTRVWGSCPRDSFPFPFLSSNILYFQGTMNQQDCNGYLILLNSSMCNYTHTDTRTCECRLFETACVPHNLLTQLHLKYMQEVPLRSFCNVGLSVRSVRNWSLNERRPVITNAWESKSSFWR